MKTINKINTYSKKLLVPLTIGATVLGFLFGAIPVSADTDPGGCSASGVGLSLSAFRSDGITPIGGGLVAEGETIVYKAVLSHLNGLNCNFEGGTLSITTPDGAVNTVASPATPVVPLITSGSPFTSVGVSYVVAYANSGGDGILDATSNYSGGTSHTPTAHSTVGASNGISVVMEGHIIVDKVSNPSSEQDFEFDSSWTVNFFLDDTDAPVNSGALVLGSYNVSEVNLPAGWNLTNTNCVSSLGDTETAGSLELDAGETITCTFTNTQSGHIIVVKDAVNNNAQDFTFNNNFGNGNPAVFLLDDDSNVTLSNTRDSEVLPGEYAVSEDAVAGWQQESATCDAGETVGSINVAPGETVTCTFVNEELAKIILVKNTIGGNGTFDFDGTGAGLPTDIDLTTVGGTASQTFSDLDQDNTYSITENVPAGWALTSSSCTGTNTPASITPNPGETVTCTFANTLIVPLEVVKTANPTYDKKWSWTIDKHADQTNLTLADGELFTVHYDVTVNSSVAVINAVVSGTITITNPAGNPTATITNVTDSLSIGGGATVVCPEALPKSLAAGDSFICTYSKNLGSANTDQTNTATVTTSGVVPGGSSNVAVVDFTTPTNIIDECIDVSDTNGALGGLPVTVCAGVDSLPKTFNYSLKFGKNTTPVADVQLVCGDNTHQNTASFVTTDDANDTDASDSDNWTVNAEVTCVSSCTLTQGYWKTHNASFKGGAPIDDNWNNITPLAELTGFFTTSVSYPVVGPNVNPFTWFSVFWTAPKGNAYYNLAHQYMAAKLNILNGASAPVSVSSAITSAEDFFDSWTPAGFAALGKKDSLRASVISWAGTLGSYNEGLIGPGHCDEQNPQ